MSWKMLVALGLASAALALLVSLGTWQMHRLAWKEELIARIEARIHAAPTALPTEAEWGALRPEDYEYRRVTLSGTFDHARETHVFRASGPNEGVSRPGYLIVTPLRLREGGIVLVTRGFVPEDKRDPDSRAAGQTAGEVTITGLMRAPESRNAFTPADDPARGAWFTRDPGLIAAHLQLERAAPFSVDADGSANPGGWPRGGATVIAIKNDHLSYALTWYGLAVTLVAILALVLWRRRRG